MKGGGGLMDVEQALRMVLSFATGVEERYLEGWNRFAIVVNQPAVAAQFSRTRIRNPVGSNMVAVLEQLSYTSGSLDVPFVTYGATTTDLSSLVTVTFSRMDPRGSPQPTAILSQAAQASGGTPFLQRSILANTNLDFINTVDQEIPILPGQVVDTQANAANVNSIVTYIWRERALEASELT